MQQNNASVVKVQSVICDPTAIGLFGLAMVTFVASSQKLGLTSGTSLVVPWALCLGAAMQIYASIVDAKHNNVFGATAFGAYGFFWAAMAMSWMIQNGVFGEAMKASADVSQMGMAFVGYLIFSLFMTVGAAGTNKVLFFIFVLIDFLFIGLALSVFGVMPHFMHGLAAWSELVIALLGFYGAGAAVLNVHFGRVVLPIGKAYIKRG